MQIKIIYVSGSSEDDCSQRRPSWLRRAQNLTEMLFYATQLVVRKESVNKPAKHTSELLIENISDNLNVAKGIDGASFFTSNNFTSTVNALTNQFDQVFVAQVTAMLS